MAALLGLAAAAGAQTFRPDLSQTLEWLAPPVAVEAQVPLDAPERTTYPMPAEQPREILDELPGRPFHQLDPPPQSAAWWKYPVYAVFGFPRDLVDSVFGFFSYWPIVNIPLVAIPYEVVPTQFVMRDPRDWHRWPGTTNRKGHGFFPAKNRVRDPRTWEGEPHEPEKLDDGSWHMQETWGFFPTARSMKFTYASKRKIRRLIDENNQMRQELEEMNREIDLANRAIAQRQQAARTAALAAIDAGRGQEAVSHMLPYHAAYPTDEGAQALLINALALYVESGPDWVRPFMFQSLSTAPPRVLQQAETLLRKTGSDFPQSLGTTEALVYIQTRLDRPDQALATAEAGYAVNPNDPRRARLYFETALAGRDPAKAAEALASIERTQVAMNELNLMRLRLDLLAGRQETARRELAQLAIGEPDNAYYQYYLGIAELASAGESERPEENIRIAFDALERAALSAPTRPLRERAGAALNFARGLAAEQDERRPRRESQPLFQFPEIN